MSAKQEEERGEGDVMCQSDKKKFFERLQKKKKTWNRTYIGERETERERERESGRGMGEFSKGRKGYQKGRGSRKKKNQKPFDFFSFFAAFVYDGTWKGEKKKKENATNGRK